MSPANSNHRGPYRHVIDLDAELERAMTGPHKNLDLFLQILSTSGCTQFAKDRCMQFSAAQGDLMRDFTHALKEAGANHGVYLKASLCHAARTGDIEKIEALFKEGAEPDDVTLRGAVTALQEQTALHLMEEYGLSVRSAFFKHRIYEELMKGNSGFSHEDKIMELVEKLAEAEFEMRGIPNLPNDRNPNI